MPQLVKVGIRASMRCGNCRRLHNQCTCPAECTCFDRFEPSCKVHNPRPLQTRESEYQRATTNGYED